MIPDALDGFVAVSLPSRDGGMLQWAMDPLDNPPDPHKRQPDQASARHTELGALFDKTLFAAIDAIEDEKLPYGLIGGVAASGLGRPRSTHDVDVFVRAEDAESVLEVLARRGFETEHYDPRWLYKAFREDMLVDIIFKSSGDIYFDDEMAARVKVVNYHGREMRVVSPEDLIIIKCAVHNENGPHHWHDALAVLSHAPVDWDYLLRRARRATRRVLALLVYAQSSDIWIPNFAIERLYNALYREGTSLITGDPQLKGMHAQPQFHAPAQYLAEKIKEAITKDARMGQTEIHVVVEGDRVMMKGEARSEAHRRAVEDVARGVCPAHHIENQVRVSPLKGPGSAEYLS